MSIQDTGQATSYNCAGTTYCGYGCNNGAYACAYINLDGTDDNCYFGYPQLSCGDVIQVEYKCTGAAINVEIVDQEGVMCGTFPGDCGFGPVDGLVDLTPAAMYALTGYYSNSILVLTTYPA